MQLKQHGIMRANKNRKEKGKMTLGERLLGYRTNLKMSQDDLAEKVGVTRQTVSKWETDQSMPEFNKILPLCEIFKITTDELIKGEDAIKEIEIKEDNLESSSNNIKYNEKRKKKKAIFISISIFLYIIGAFSMPYMVESLNYDGGHAVMVLGTLWAIATSLLIYFFVSNPKLKEETIAEKEPKTIYKIIENRVIRIVALIFLMLYLTISFISSAWHITWILWIVFAVVEGIVKLIFDIKRGENNGK